MPGICGSPGISPAGVLERYLHKKLTEARKGVALSEESVIHISGTEETLKRCDQAVNALAELEAGNPEPACNLLEFLFNVETECAEKFQELPPLQLEFLREAILYGSATRQLYS